MSTELTLTDRYKTPSIVVEKAPSLQPSSVGLKLTGQLPEALVDDLLLRELASIPDKMGFKIGDVAEMLEVKQYVLRYWEAEFDLLKPKKAANNQRYYNRKDVESAYLIRKLLHRDRFSLEGAKAALKNLKKAVKKEQEGQNFSERIQVFEKKISEMEASILKLKTLFIEGPHHKTEIS